MVSVTKIYEYYKRHGHATEVMGASFRNAGEICELAGCDLLTIAPKLLDELATQQGTLIRKLDPERAKTLPEGRIEMNREVFHRMHEADRMASDKLAEGITGFSKAAEALEKLLEARLARLEGDARLGDAAKRMYAVYDLDGDGEITREEWGGTDAVFDALDRDADGRISPAELAAGLGAAHFLATRSER